MKHFSLAILSLSLISTDLVRSEYIITHTQKAITTTKTTPAVTGCSYNWHDYLFDESFTSGCYKFTCTKSHSRPSGWAWKKKFDNQRCCLYKGQAINVWRSRTFRKDACTKEIISCSWGHHSAYVKTTTRTVCCLDEDGSVVRPGEVILHPESCSERRCTRMANNLGHTLVSTPVFHGECGCCVKHGELVRDGFSIDTGSFNLTCDRGTLKEVTDHKEFLSCVRDYRSYLDFSEEYHQKRHEERRDGGWYHGSYHHHKNVANPWSIDWLRRSKSFSLFNTEDYPNMITRLRETISADRISRVVFLSDLAYRSTRPMVQMLAAGLPTGPNLRAGYVHVSEDVAWYSWNEQCTLDTDVPEDNSWKFATVKGFAAGMMATNHLLDNHDIPQCVLERNNRYYWSYDDDTRPSRYQNDQDHVLLVIAVSANLGSKLTPKNFLNVGLANHLRFKRGVTIAYVAFNEEKRPWWHDPRPAHEKNIDFMKTFVSVSPVDSKPLIFMFCLNYRHFYDSKKLVDHCADHCGPHWGSYYHTSWELTGSDAALLYRNRLVPRCGNTTIYYASTASTESGNRGYAQPSIYPTPYGGPPGYSGYSDNEPEKVLFSFKHGDYDCKASVRKLRDLGHYTSGHGTLPAHYLLKVDLDEEEESGSGHHEGDMMESYEDYDQMEGHNNDTHYPMGPMEGPGDGNDVHLPMEPMDGPGEAHPPMEEGNQEPPSLVEQPPPEVDLSEVEVDEDEIRHVIQEQGSEEPNPFENLLMNGDQGQQAGQDVSPSTTANTE